MQLNMQLSKEDFERDGYSIECDVIQFPLFWDSRIEQLPARHAADLQSQLLSKLQALNMGPPVLLAFACLCGLLALLFGIRLRKLNQEQDLTDHLIEKEVFIVNDLDEDE